MCVSYLAAFLVLLQPPQPPLPSVNLKWAMKIPLRYRSPREFDALFGPIYYPNSERITWPLRGGYTPGASISGARVPGFQGPMRPPGIDTIVAMDEGALLVQGDPADIEELTAFVRELRGKKKLLTATAAGKAGTVVRATNALTGPAAVAARVEVTFKITPLGVGRYEIESQGKVSVPLAKRGMRLEKTFQSTRELTPGQTLTLDRVELGGETVQLLLTVKPEMK